MIDLKLTVVSAILGLVFSLLIGMVSDVSIGYMMLRGVISAVLTGGIAAAASFVFRKFLAGDAVNITPSQTASPTGNIVDITLKVDEDVLPDTDNAPPFIISPESLRSQKPVDIYRMAAMKSAEKTSSAPENVSEKDNAGGFIPQPLVSENTPQYSAVPETHADADIPASAGNSAGSAVMSGNMESVENLDELPDLSDVTADSDEEITDVISDSDFATANNPTTNYSAPAGKDSVDVGNDTALMANTIRTLLKSEG